MDLLTESGCVEAAQQSLSDCNWAIGEAASMWSAMFSRGRSLAEFGAAVGLTGEQLEQRRKVFDSYSPIARELYSNLRWSHFFAAVDWGDRDACLRWASGMDATVGEMKAWRQAMRGDAPTLETLF